MVTYYLIGPLYREESDNVELWELWVLDFQLKKKVKWFDTFLLLIVTECAERFLSMFGAFVEDLEWLEH